MTKYAIIETNVTWKLTYRIPMENEDDDPYSYATMIRENIIDEEKQEFVGESFIGAYQERK